MQRAQWALFFVMTLVFFWGCKEEKANLNGNESVKMEVFLAACPIMNLPCRVTDTNFVKMADTTTISKKVFSAFVPDSIIEQYANAKKIQIHVLGKIEKDNGIYILATFSQQHKHISKNALGVFFFDKKYNFLGHLPLLNNDNKDQRSHYVAINKEPTFTIAQEQNSSTGIKFTRRGYGYNQSSGDFILLLNESNETVKPEDSDIYNPIDSLPKKNKYSGDYIKDKKNFISIRDGKNASYYIFFIHIEKNDGECTGELKGEMNIMKHDKAFYKEKAGPCGIDFQFSEKRVEVKERSNCGNHRGMRCYFDDKYIKSKKAISSK